MATLPEGTHSTTLTGRDVVTAEPIERIIVWADRPYNYCTRCGQTVGYEVPNCPVNLDLGAGWGGQLLDYDQKHGCGQWLLVSWREVDDEAAIEAAAQSLAENLAKRIEGLRKKTRAALAKQLRAAQARLAEPLDEAAGETTADREEEVLSGSEVTPGVFRDGDALLAWAYDPSGRDDEGISVRE